MEPNTLWRCISRARPGGDHKSATGQSLPQRAGLGHGRSGLRDGALRGRLCRFV